ncbi:putative oxysterol binding protein [Diplocarpon rosae]|nr:putative oxysterol binding protein [Diplocarpon rosae]
MSEQLAPQQKGAFFSFLKSLASFKGDLASLTAPPFLLSSQSIIEFSAYWAEHPSLLVAPAREPDPEKRALLVLKWFLSTLKEQHNNKDANGKKKRMKPLNPFLGELFLGKWVDEAGTTNLVAEQVSHHPPITACNIWNDVYGVRLAGHVAPKASFSTTVNIERKGYSVLHLDNFDEDYLITMPKIHIEGMMTGSLAPELSGTTYIRSSSGYTAKIQYSCKGWLSGKRNSFVANLYHDEQERKPLYTLEGQWSGEYTIRKGATQVILEKCDASKLSKTPLTVAPIETQHPLESRRAWRHVVDGIEQGDIFTIGEEKSRIENEQREMRKREKVEGKEFQRRYFSRMGRDFVAERLAEGIKDPSFSANMGGYLGVWMWDEEKYRRVQKESRDGMKSPIRARLDSGVGGMLLDDTDKE